MKQYEERIIRAMYEESNKITASDTLKRRIDREIDSVECNGKMEEKKMRKFSIKRLAIAAAAACFLIPTAVYAGGAVAGYATGIGIGGFQSFESYDELDAAKEKAGFDFVSVESFSNGYEFNGMEVSTTDKLDEEGNRFGSFKEWSGSYQDENGNRINVNVHETLPDAEKEGAEEPHDSREIDGVTVEYSEDSYMFVPVDYELTEEDKEFGAQPHCYISVGTDEVQHDTYRHVSWDKDGIYYLISGMGTPLEMEDLYEMAGEMIGK